MHLVHDFLEHSAARHPAKTALVFEGRRLTYAEVDAAANRLANALRERGVGRGDRVVVYLPNGAEAVIAIFAALKADAVFVVVNPTTKADKLARLVANCTPAAIVAPAAQEALVRDLAAAAPSLRCGVLTGDVPAGSARGGLVAYDEIQRAASDGRPVRRCIDQDLACLIYTSGSTGEPQGVMSSHRNVTFAAWSITTYLRNVPEDVIISALPLSFDYGLYQLLMAFRIGGTLVLERSFVYPAQVLQRLAAERATGLPCVPTMFALLLQMDLGQFDLRSVRYLTNTAAALAPSQIAALRQRLPWATLYSMYGLTETKRTLYLPPDQLDKRPGSVGIAIPGTEVWLEDEHGRRVGPGGTGELVVRGGHVMRGYWGDPVATARRFRPGPIPGETVCYSDDLFRMDEEGYLYFVGRRDEIIKSRGEKVSPREVEDVLHALPGVVEAAVVGVPDPVLGEAVKAVLVTSSPALTEKEVLRHCRARLEDFMVPKHVRFVDSLPKTPSGKVQKKALRSEP